MFPDDHDMKWQNHPIQKLRQIEFPTEMTEIPSQQAGYRYRTIKNGIQDDRILNWAYRIPGTASTIRPDASMGRDQPHWSKQDDECF